MQAGLHQFHQDSIEWLRRAVGEEGCTRRQLAQELCEREGWRNGKDDLCLASARRILPKLAGELGISLPPPRERMPQKAPPRDFPVASLRLGGGRRGHAGADVTGGRQAAVGRRIIRGRDRRARSAVTGSCCPAMASWAAFCAASWHQKARDEFVGWSADARVANLQLMVNNYRFLLLSERMRDEGRPLRDGTGAQQRGTCRSALYDGERWATTRNLPKRSLRWGTLATRHGQREGHGPRGSGGVRGRPCASRNADRFVRTTARPRMGFLRRLRSSPPGRPWLAAPTGTTSVPPLNKDDAREPAQDESAVEVEPAVSENIGSIIAGGIVVALERYWSAMYALA